MSAVDLVVVGASLGGLSAIRQVLTALPEAFAPAVAIAQHRQSNADGRRLTDLLGSVTALPVVEPEDKEPIHGGRIYVAPANYHMIVDDGLFWLTVDAPVLYARPSIDVLFESAAECFGPGVVAVVLTGSSEDGAAGSRAIKRAGGVVLVQDPGDAESPTLPRATITHTAVDRILPLPALAQALVDVVRARGGVG
jgi:two-component system chemotaxis response regulator CheB